MKSFLLDKGPKPFHVFPNFPDVPSFSFLNVDTLSSVFHDVTFAKSPFWSSKPLYSSFIIIFLRSRLLLNIIVDKRQVRFKTKTRKKNPISRNLTNVPGVGSYLVNWSKTGFSIFNSETCLLTMLKRK